MPAGYYGLVKLMNGEELLTRVVEDDGEYCSRDDDLVA